MKVISALIIAVGVFAVSACNIPDNSASDAPDGNSQAPATLAIFEATPNEPLSEAQFESDLVKSYNVDQSRYDAAPNNLAKNAVVNNINEICSIAKKYYAFSGWVGKLTAISSFLGDSNLAQFSIDIGNGFSLRSNLTSMIDKKSPAYALLSSAHIGDEVSVSGKLLYDGDLGRCGGVSDWDLDNGKIGDGNFDVEVDEINGVSAKVLNEAPGASSNSDSDSSDINSM